MKKIAITLTLGVLTVVSGFAQGTVAFNNGTSSKISTNSVVGGAPTGVTAATANSYYYALFYSTTATTVGGSSAAVSGQNAIYAFSDSAWTFGAYGVEAASAGRFASTSADGNGATAVSGLPASSTAQFVVVGWSANIGTTWQSVLAYLANPTSTGWVGQSNVSTPITTGGGVGLPPGLFGATGPITGFTLGEVTPTPEPGTIALAGLGIASLLALRRKK